MQQNALVKGSGFGGIDRLSVEDLGFLGLGGGVRTEAIMAVGLELTCVGLSLTNGIRNANPFVLSSCPSLPSDDCPPLVRRSKGTPPCAKSRPLVPIFSTLPLTFPPAITDRDPVRIDEVWVISILGLEGYRLSPTAPSSIMYSSIKFTMSVRSFFIITMVWNLFRC